MESGRLLPELATDLNKFANQQLINLFRDLTDTSPDAEMSIVPLGRKIEILASNLQKRLELETLISNLTNLTKTSPNSEIESLYHSFEKLLDQQVDPHESLIGLTYQEILLRLEELLRPMEKVASELSRIGDQQLRESLEKLAKSPFETVTKDLASLTQISPDSKIESSRNIFYRLLTKNQNLPTTSAGIYHKILLNLAALRPVNKTCFLTLEPINDEDAIYISTGHQFDKTVLLDYIKQYGYKNPYYNEPFSRHDIAHLKKCIPGLPEPQSDTNFILTDFILNDPMFITATQLTIISNILSNINNAPEITRLMNVYMNISMHMAYANLRTDFTDLSSLHPRIIMSNSLDTDSDLNEDSETDDLTRDALFRINNPVMIFFTIGRLADTYRNILSANQNRLLLTNGRVTEEPRIRELTDDELIQENDNAYTPYELLRDLIHNNVLQAGLLAIAIGLLERYSSELFRTLSALVIAYAVLTPVVNIVRGGVATLFQPAANGQNQPRRNQQPTQP